MEWIKIKNNYPDSWYSLVDYIADPLLYKERRIRICDELVLADTMADDGNWLLIKSFSQRELYEFFEMKKIFISILYNDWFEFYSFEIFSELKNDISAKFASRSDAETRAFITAFALLENTILI
jgi:hypothetical protein